MSHANLAFDFKIKRTLIGLSYPPALWNAVWMGALEPRELGELFRDPAKIEEVYSEAIEAWDRCRQPDVVDRALQFWTNLYLQDGILAKVDRASMLCSLEARSPFLDMEVANLARRIPWHSSCAAGRPSGSSSGRSRRCSRRRSCTGRKRASACPIGRWLREGRFTFRGPTPAGMRPEFLDTKLKAHLAGKADERLYLWCAWVLGQWLHHANR